MINYLAYILPLLAVTHLLNIIFVRSFEFGFFNLNNCFNTLRAQSAGFSGSFVCCSIEL